MQPQETEWERTYLCTELEINHDDADLRTGDHQDDEDQKEETKQVIELILPDGLRVVKHTVKLMENGNSLRFQS